MTWKVRYSIAALVIFLALFLWSVFIEPRIIDETEIEASIPNLPEAWRGARIAFIADMQVGMFLDNRDTIRRMVGRIIAGRPAAVFIGGDFIYHPTEGDESPAEAREEYEREDLVKATEIIHDAAEILRPLVEAGLPVFAVLGNHDYAMENKNSLKLPWVAEKLTNALETIGIAVLQNASTVLPPPGPHSATDEPLFLVGIGPYYPNEGDVQKAFKKVPKPAVRVVMLHNPELFPAIPAGQAPFAIAGHTHGGQIRIPFLESWSWLSIIRGREVHTDDWIQNFGRTGNRLYVNRGIGFSVLPVRLNCPPELTWILLTREQPDS